MFVETTKMQAFLLNHDYKDIVILRNFRNFEIFKQPERLNYNYPINLCIFSRVMKEKGILEAINTVDEINNESVTPVCSLDIYGSIEKTFLSTFDNIIEDNKQIKYKGTVKQTEVIETLKVYDLILFPTKFYTEGIPGTIIDGFFAGVPTLCSKWENFRDVIEDDFSGFTFEFNDFLDFKKKLKTILFDPSNIEKVKQNLSVVAEKYTSISNKDILIRGIQNEN